MNLRAILSLYLLGGVVWAQNTAPAPVKSSVAQPAITPKPPSAPKPKRVRADLSGFELEKKTSNSSVTQVAAASRSGARGTTLYAPNKGLALSPSPTFLWSAGASGEDFVFRIYDENNELIYETKASGGRFHYPADAPPLAPGRTYLWAVQPEGRFKGEPPRPAQFEVLAAARRKPVESALAGASSNFRRAEILAENRIWYDAIEAYSKLIEENPGKAGLYAARGNIYDQVAATQPLAEQDFAIAEKLTAGRNAQLSKSPLLP